jgi:hypothetical protein
LLDAGNDAPGGTAGTDNVLVGDRQQITLVDSELAANLIVSSVVSQRQEWLSRTTA